MKYNHMRGILTIFVLAITLASGPLFAKGETTIKKHFQANAVGIATSSGSMQHFKEKLLKLRTNASSLSPVDNFTNKNKVEPKR